METEFNSFIIEITMHSPLEYIKDFFFFNPKNRMEKIICSRRKFSRCRWSNSAAVWGKCEKQMLKMIYNCAKNEEKELYIFTRERISNDSHIRGKFFDDFMK